MMSIISSTTNVCCIIGSNSDSNCSPETSPPSPALHLYRSSPSTFSLPSLNAPLPPNPVLSLHFQPSCSLLFFLQLFPSFSRLFFVLSPSLSLPLFSFSLIPPVLLMSLCLLFLSLYSLSLLSSPPSLSPLICLCCLFPSLFSFTSLSLFLLFSFPSTPLFYFSLPLLSLPSSLSLLFLL